MFLRTFAGLAKKKAKAAKAQAASSILASRKKQKLKEALAALRDPDMPGGDKRYTILRESLYKEHNKESNTAIRDYKESMEQEWRLNQYEIHTNEQKDLKIKYDRMRQAMEYLEYIDPERFKKALICDKPNTGPSLPQSDLEQLYFDRMLKAPVESMKNE